MIRLSEYHLPFHYDTSYAYAVGRIRALETRLLTSQDFARLLAAEDIEALFRILAETDYGQVVVSAKDPEDFEAQLNVHLASILNLIVHLSKDPVVTNLLRSRYDYHNLKLFLKARATDRDVDAALLEVGLIEPAVLIKAIEGEGLGDIPGYLRRTIERAEPFLAQEIDPQGLDVLVDKDMYHHHLSVLQKSKAPFLWGWMEREIDVTNIKTFFRLRWAQEMSDLLRQHLCTGGSLSIEFYRTLVEEPQDTMPHRFGSTRYAKVVEEGASFLQAKGSFARLEQLCDGYLLSYLRRASFVTFGVEPLVSYVVIKEYEIKALRTVAVGKWNRIKLDAIRERLPDAYV